MDRSTPGLPVHHQHQLAQTHVYRVSDIILPSHPLLSPFPPAFNLFQHQGLFQKSVLHIKWPKYWSFSFRISPFNECSGLISLRIDWFDLHVFQGIRVNKCWLHNIELTELCKHQPRPCGAGLKDGNPSALLTTASAPAVSSSPLPH